jgi:hypothetical protein
MTKRITPTARAALTVGDGGFVEVLGTAFFRGEQGNALITITGFARADARAVYPSWPHMQEVWALTPKGGTRRVRKMRALAIARDARSTWAYAYP